MDRTVCRFGRLPSACSVGTESSLSSLQLEFLPSSPELALDHRLYAPSAVTCARRVYTTACAARMQRPASSRILLVRSATRKPSLGTSSLRTGAADRWRVWTRTSPIRRLAIALSALLMLGGCAAPKPLTGAWGEMFDDHDGYLIVRATGLPVYTSIDDRPDVSRCVSSCLRFFKPVQAPTSTASPDATFKTFVREDGTLQVEYLGRPLYTSVIDASGSPPRAHRIHDGWALVSVR